MFSRAARSLSGKDVGSRSAGVRVIADDDKPEILKAYLDRFTLTVQRYFPISAGSPAEAFRPLAGRYPVFELTPKA
jgi:hypothetical protein